MIWPRNTTNSPSVRVLEVEPDESQGDAAPSEAQQDHGQVEPEVDDAELVGDDGPVLRDLVVDPHHLVLAVRDVGRGPDQAQVVRLHVVVGDHLVQPVLQLLHLGPRYPVASVLVEGHRALE